MIRSPPSGGTLEGVIAPPIPLLWAKLTPPKLPADVVPRGELLDRLAGSGAALTAIVAPAGYGKTTLAVQLTRTLGRPVAWVSLDGADDEPVRFWTYVSAALCAADVVGADGTYGPLAAGRERVADASLQLRSAVEAHGTDVVLVLDDLQSIGDPVIVQTLADWLRHPLANLRIVCTSRRDLPLPVGRLRSQGHLTEARIDDLAFDGVEAATLLADAFGVDDLTADQLAALGRRTEGWPVGLYLAGLALRDEPDVAGSIDRFTGDTRHLSEYLAAEAMDGLSDDARAFALATSILTVLDPALCDAVTESVGSLRLLRELVADNVFTSPLDDGATIFQYHPLWREHLRSDLAENHPELVGPLHARASIWHEANGDVEAAIEHATASGDQVRAERLIGEQFLPYANAGHFGTLLSWVDALGPRQGLGAETAVMMAWLALNLRRYDELDRWLAQAAANAAHPAEEASVALQGPTIRAHRARHEGDVGALLEWAAEAVAAATTPVDLDVPVLRFGDEGRGAALAVAATAAYWAGRPDLARDRLVEAQDVGRSKAMVLEQVFRYQYLAIIEADAGNHQAALDHADQALSSVEEGTEHYQLPTLAHLARSVALAGLGRPADAADALASARRVAAYRREPLYDAAIELQAARLHHLEGDQDEARASVRAARAIVADLPDPRFDERVRATENAIRFVAADADALPVGARELTDRERAVLGLLPHDLSRRELARQLHVSENTVKTHLTSIRHKLGVTGRQQIVARAVELGLLPSDRSVDP